MFYDYTLAFSMKIEPSLLSVYRIYNTLFNHLELLQGWLEKKKKQWKRDLDEAIGAAYAKLSKYYRQTYTNLEYLYAMATILSPRHKLDEFRSPECQDERDWCEEYGMIFTKLFCYYAKSSGTLVCLAVS